MAGIYITTTPRGSIRPLAYQGIFVTDCYHQVQALLNQRLGADYATLLAEPMHDAKREYIDWYAPESLAHNTSGSAPSALSSLPPDEAARIREQVGERAQRIQQLGMELGGTTAQDEAANANGFASDSPSPANSGADGVGSVNPNTAAQPAPRPTPLNFANAATATGEGAYLSGPLLLLSLNHPHEDDIWVVNGQPVVINWGFGPGTVGALPQDLSRLAKAPIAAALPVAAPPVPPVTVPVGRRWGCLPILLSLLGLLLALLLALAALSMLVLPTSCTPPKLADNGALLQEEYNKGVALQNDIEDLRALLAQRAAQCRPPQPETPRLPVAPPASQPEPVPVPPATEPEVIPPPEPEVTEPFLGETPVQPDPPKAKPAPKPAPKPEPKPEPIPEPEPKPEPKPKAQKNDPLTIPKEAPKSNDMSFLEGCWRSESGLANARTGAPIIAEYCFDKNGKGRRLVREKNGQVCNGSARATFAADGRLLVEADEAHCPRSGSSYVPQKVECTGNETSTRCKGRERSNELVPRRWDAKFYRK